MFVLPGTSQLYSSIMVEYTWHHRANGTYVYMSKGNLWAQENNCPVVEHATFPNITSTYMVAYGTALTRAHALSCGGSAVTQYVSVQTQATEDAFQRYGDDHVSRGLIGNSTVERDSLRPKWEEKEAQCECRSMHAVIDDPYGNFTIEHFWIGLDREYVNAVNGWHDKIDFTGSISENVKLNEKEGSDTTTCCSCYDSEGTNQIANAADCSKFSVEDLSETYFLPSVHHGAAMIGW